MLENQMQVLLGEVTPRLQFTLKKPLLKLIPKR